jgi:hypothetical protein
MIQIDLSNGELYTHEMVIDSMNISTGKFSGHGWAQGYKNEYTWTIDGTVSGSSVIAALNFTDDYLNTSYGADWTDVIVNHDGSISGKFNEYSGATQGYYGTFKTISGNAVSAVPVPSTSLLLGSCLLLLACLQRKASLRRIPGKFQAS